jgi:creatinine amidohydrolase
MEKVRLAEMSWREVEAALHRGAAAIFPMASTEEHGPHAPMGDYLVEEEIALRVARQTGDLVVPPLAFGYSEYFRKYPGVITLQSQTLFAFVEDVVLCLIRHGFTHIALFNGHKGNEPTLMHLARKIRREHGLLIPIVSSSSFGVTAELIRELYGPNYRLGHGGEPMGSVYLHVMPGTVDLSKAETWGQRDFLGLPADGLAGVHFEGTHVGFAVDMDDIAPPSGSLSDPQVASADKGERQTDVAVAGAVRFMKWFKGVEPRVEKG